MYVMYENDPRINLKLQHNNIVMTILVVLVNE